MERLKFIGKKTCIPCDYVFGVATLVFILTKLVPGDPVTANLSREHWVILKLWPPIRQNTDWISRLLCSMYTT